MQKGPAQHIARYGGNKGSENWPFWLDVQAILLLTYLHSLGCACSSDLLSILPCPALPCPALPCQGKDHGAAGVSALASFAKSSSAAVVYLQCGETVTVSIAASFLTKTSALDSFLERVPDWVANSATTTFQASWTF